MQGLSLPDAKLPIQSSIIRVVFTYAALTSSTNEQGIYYLTGSPNCLATQPNV